MVRGCQHSFSLISFWCFLQVCRKNVKSMMEPPSDKQIEVMLKDLNEVNEEKLKHNEQLLSEWIKCQEHFPKNIGKFYPIIIISKLDC